MHIDCARSISFYLKDCSAFIFDWRVVLGEENGLHLFSLNNLRVFTPPGFPGGSEVKAAACNVGDQVLIPGSGKIPWRRKWQPTPVLLPGESHGRLSLVGYNPWGCKESDTTEQLHFTSLGEPWEEAEERGLGDHRDGAEGVVGLDDQICSPCGTL